MTEKGAYHSVTKRAAYHCILNRIADGDGTGHEDQLVSCRRVEEEIEGGCSIRNRI